MSEGELEQVAQAMWEADCGAVSYEWSEVSEGGRSKWRRLARAALLARPAIHDEVAELVFRTILVCREQGVTDPLRTAHAIAVALRLAEETT